ncbi:MAG: DUF3187 family protein [Pseudomonadales bacterium]
MSWPGRSSAALALCWLTLGGGVASGQEQRSAESGARLAAPLRVRNLSPATQLYGLPRAFGALVPSATTELTLQVEHANNFTAGGSSGATAAVFDGGTTVTGLTLRRALGQRFEWGLELPYVHHGGGFTDAFIDGFHDLFGLPEGGRDDAPTNRLDYRLVSAGATRVALDDAAGHLGDVRGWLGYRLLRGPGREAVLRGMVKAPSGRVADLSGSEGTDVSLAVELADSVSLEALGLTMTLMGAATALGNDALPGTPQEALVWSGHFGLHYPLTGRLILRGQLDAHSDVIDTGLRQFAGATVQGTLGGSVMLGPRAWLDVGVSEDLAGASAPDVVFLLALGASL